MDPAVRGFSRGRDHTPSTADRAADPAGTGDGGFRDLESAKGELDHLLRSSVREHLVSDVPHPDYPVEPFGPAAIWQIFDPSRYPFLEGATFRSTALLDRRVEPLGPDVVIEGYVHGPH